MPTKTKTVVQKNVEQLILLKKREIERDLQVMGQDNLTMAGGMAQIIARRAEEIRGLSDGLHYLVKDHYLFSGMKLADLRIALGVARALMAGAATAPQLDLAGAVPTPYANGLSEVYQEIARAIERKTHSSYPQVLARRERTAAKAGA